LAVPLAIVEPLKLVALFVVGDGHFITGVFVLLCAYAVSLFVTERLFMIVKPKLFTLPWFAKIWSWFVAIRGKFLQWLRRKWGGDRVTEQASEKIVELRQPIQCVLWQHPDRVAGQFAQAFEVVESYEDGSHLSRSFYKCRECGQLYFYEWYEWVDWQHGNDKQYSTFVPVQTAEEITALKQTDTFSLLRFFPRPQWDGSKIGWIGK
jgi:hypothetical protein